MQEDEKFGRTREGELVLALGVMNEYVGQSPPFMVRKDSFNLCPL